MRHSDDPNQAAEQAWQELLDQLQAPPVPPRPFFYTRLQARLAETAPAPAPARWLRRPAFAALLGGLMLVLHADSATSGTADGGPAAGSRPTLARQPGN